jgi:S1-C subfamily serine protease
LIPSQNPVPVLKAASKEMLAALKTGTPVFAIGFPHGLPMKVARGKIVRKLADPILELDLDLFTGNSGGPLFAVFDGVPYVIGIVVEASTQANRWVKATETDGSECRLEPICRTAGDPVEKCSWAKALMISEVFPIDGR